MMAGISEIKIKKFPASMPETAIQQYIGVKQREGSFLFIQIILYRKPFPSFCTAPVYNLATAFRRHPDKKAMGSGTLNPAWLICSFHLFHLFNFKLMFSQKFA